MNNLKEKKLDNKGFSLVELIIVIAIMAVLIGVLAPQYLKYVERSRVSADGDQVDTLISAVEIYSADHGVVTGTLTLDTNGKVTPSAGEVTTALTDAGLDASKITLTSKTFKKACTINFSDAGVTVSDSGIAEVLGRATTATP